MPKARIKKNNTPRERRIIIPEKINFVISYKNYMSLARFMNDRAKVQGKKRTGIAAKQQRRIAREIKRARHLGLLPFSSRV